MLVGMTFRDADRDDLPEILALLREAALPVDGVAEHLDRFVVGIERDGLRAAGGFERDGPEALLRSIVLAPSLRGRGFGRLLYDAVAARAKREGVSDFYLLTEGAEPFFARLGFARIERGAVPEAIRTTEEFRVLCPASAVLMTRRL